MPEHRDDNTPDDLDTRIDHALTRIHAEDVPDEQRVRAVRTRLLDTVRHHPEPRHTRPNRVLTIAAAAAVLAGGIFVAQTVGGAGLQPSASAAAISNLTRAADNAHDEPVPPGDYRYIRTHRSSTGGFPDNRDPDANCWYRTHTVIEVWIPADPAREWLQRTTEPNERTWLRCSEREAVRQGFPLPTGPRVEERRAARGHFNGENIGRENGRDIPLPPPGFGNPTPEFLAGLPRDPQRLYHQIQQYVQGDVEDDRPDLVFDEIRSLLTTGLATADLRAALYRAATYIEGVEVIDTAVNLDGRTGTALGFTEDGAREQLIIDPATGEFIGQRSVHDEMPAGTGDYTAVHTDVAGDRGVAPS